MKTVSWTKMERKCCITAFAPNRWRTQLAAQAAKQITTEKSQRRIILVIGEMEFLSLERMCEFVRYQIGANPCSGDLYVFCNGARSTLRYFEWDGTGFCAGFRKAHRGTFPWPWAKDIQSMEISENEWEYLLHKSARTLMRTNLKNP